MSGKTYVVYSLNMGKECINGQMCILNSNLDWTVLFGPVSEIKIYSKSTLYEQIFVYSWRTKRTTNSVQITFVQLCIPINGSLYYMYKCKLRCPLFS